MSVVEFPDFSGGMTDELTCGIRNRFAKLENCLITHDKETFSRAGSVILDSNLVSTVKSSGKTGNLFNFQNDTALLIRATSKLLVKPVATWSELLGPNANHLFNASPAFTAESIAHSDEWSGHLFIVGNDPTVSSYATPQKVFLDASGNYQLLNMGMQKFPDNTDAAARATLQTNANTMANEIRTVMMAHLAHVSDTFTVSIATPAVITMANHNYSVGDTVIFTTTGALPTGLVAGNAYYVSNVPTSNTFRVSSTLFGSDINTSGTQSGTHSIRYHTAAQPLTFAAVASNEATLITLTKSLMAAHLAHMQDARSAITTYHLNSSFNGSFGHFYLETTPDPTTLEECVPILNRLKMLFNCHIISYDFFRVGLLTHFSRKNVSTILTTDLTVNPYPVWSSSPSLNPDYGGNEFMTYLENYRTQLNLHYTNQAGAYHPTPDGSSYMPRSLTSNMQNHEFVMAFYRSIHSYQSHRLYDAPIHNGAESNTTAINSIGNYQDVGGTMLYAPNLTTAAGYQTIYDNLTNLSTVAAIHTADLGRHTANSGALNTSIWDAFTAGSYVLAFVYKNKYTIQGGTEFENRGTPYFYGPIIMPAAVAGGIVVGGYNQAHVVAAYEQLPALPTTDNWPTSTLTKEVYRTINGGTTFYKIAEVLNSEKTAAGGALADLVLDRVDDTTLQSLEELYTTGGVAPNDPPPKCTGFMILKGTGYYGGVVEQVKGVDAPNPKLIRQSILGNPEAAPETFGATLEQDFTLWGAPRNVPVAVTKKGVYRLDGTINDLGQGEIDAVPISHTVGSECPQSGATFNDIFYFAGLDGFYMTDGYQVNKISKHLDDTYKTLVSSSAKKRQIQAKVDILNHRIYWAANQGSSGQNDVIFVLDLNHTAGDGGSFTRFSNGTHFAPTAIEFYQGVLVRGDSQGFVFTHTEGLTSDPKISRAASGSLTGDNVYIPWNIRTIADELDHPGVTKWVSRAGFVFQNSGNLSVQPGGINDLNSGNLRLLNPIRFRQEYGGMIDESRFFPSATDATKTGGGLRAMFKQVDLVPATVILFGSVHVTPATKASSSGSLVTLDSSSYVWPTDIVDWSIAFASDGYTTYYPVTARNSPTTITVTGTPALAGSQDWLLRGVPKDERMQCLSISVRFVPFLRGGRASTGEDGGN